MFPSAVQVVSPERGVTMDTGYEWEKTARYNIKFNVLSRPELVQDLLDEIDRLNRKIELNEEDKEDARD